jgi:putative endonuclease
MALHNELGKKGEALAGEYLAGLGFSVLFRNWKHGRYEIDIVAVKDGVLHFIEVKTRQSTRFGLPEESVDRKKLRHLVYAGEAFTRVYPQWKRIQFDILSISMTAAGVEYFLIEDVYL